MVSDWTSKFFSIPGVNHDERGDSLRKDASQVSAPARFTTAAACVLAASLQFFAPAVPASHAFSDANEVMTPAMDEFDDSVDLEPFTYDVRSGCDEAVRTFLRTKKQPTPALIRLMRDVVA